MKLFQICIAAVLSFCVTNTFAAGSKNNFYADDLPVLEKKSRLLLLPLHDNNHFQGDEKAVLFDELSAQLRKLGHTLDTPTFVQMVGAEFAPEIQKNYLFLMSEHIPNTPTKADAKANFAKMIQYIGDLVIMPSVVSRPAILDKTTARWDNGSHTLQTMGVSSEYLWTGEIQGLSLRLEAYSTDGEWLFTSFGGVSLPVVANIPDRRYVRKENVFEHKKDIRRMKKGVKKSIYPIRKRLKL